jgi:hypothetical protein
VFAVPNEYDGFDMMLCIDFVQRRLFSNKARQVLFDYLTITNSKVAHGDRIDDDVTPNV